MRILEIGKTAGITFAALVLLAGTAVAQGSRPVPLSPQPADADLTPGIAVNYYYHFVRHIDELRRWMGYKEGDPGAPIVRLDYSAGQDPVLTSTRSKGVGAHMTGAIFFKEPGTYQFTALTNDGFELNIGGALILEDPDVHYDRWSDVVSVDIAEAGWYGLEMLYFQRKGTATLELYWRPPWDVSDGDMKLVPAEVFAHGSHNAPS